MQAHLSSGAGGAEGIAQNINLIVQFAFLEKTEVGHSLWELFNRSFPKTQNESSGNSASLEIATKKKSWKKRTHKPN